MRVGYSLMSFLYYYYCFVQTSVMTREKIEEVFARLMDGVGSLTTEIHSRQESEKVEEEEREIMRKLREMQVCPVA